MLVLYTRYYFLNPMMIGYKQMGNSILSCFGTMIYIFLKLVIKNLQLHYSILFHRVAHLNQHHSISEKSINHFLHCRNPTSTSQPRKPSIFFKKHKFFKPSLFVNQLCIIYMFVKFLYLYMLKPFVLLVLPFLFQLILVNQF